MAFNILIRDPDKRFVGDFEYLLEDTAFSLVQSDEQSWQDSAALEAQFGRRPPKIAVNFLSDNLQSLSEKQLAELDALVAYCEKRKLPLIHLSHFRVFGESYQEKGWREGDLPEPEDAFGNLLLQMENRVADLDQSIFLRPSWLLDGVHAGLLKRFLEPMLAGEEVVVSDRHFGSPLSGRFIARAVFAMIQQIMCGAENWGVFHLHSSDKCSEAEFADQLYRLLSNEFKLTVKSPNVVGVDDERYLVLGCAHLLGRRCTANFGIQLPTWRSGFARVVKNWMDRSVHRDGVNNATEKSEAQKQQPESKSAGKKGLGNKGLHKKKPVNQPPENTDEPGKKTKRA